MPRGVGLPVAVAATLALLATPLLAQETTGRLEGRVLDAKGQPIADVSVTVTSPALQGGRGCLTNARGAFLLLALPIGEYTVKLAHLSYQKQTIEHVRVRLGQRTSLRDIRLAEQVYEQPEVTVSGKRPLIDPVATDFGGVLATKEVESLPLARDYRSVAMLLPEANLSYLGDPINFAGSTGLENRFFIDGVDVVDPWRFKDATGLPYNFVQEVEVRTGGYEAEYRSALGGTVNAITYSGGNQVTAQTYGYYTRNRPVADPRYALRPNTEDFALYDIGLGVGGPVLRDRLWYYFAYNPTFTVEDVPVQGWGLHEDKTVVHNFAAKLTWRANPKNTVILNAFGDLTSRRGVNAPWYNWGTVALASPDPALQRINTGGANFALEGRHTLRDDLLLESSLSLGIHRGKYGPDADKGEAAMPFTDEIAGLVSGDAGAPSNEQNQVFQGRLTGTWWKGKHELKTGIEYKDAQDNLGALLYGGGELRLKPDSTWVYHASAAAGRAGTRSPSLFVQDGWRLTDRIRLNVGLRWEAVYIISTERKVAQSIADEWQPRLGLAWDVDGTGSQKLSASFGSFYHDVPIWPVFWFYNNSNYDSTIYYRHDPRIDPTIYPGDSVAVWANSGNMQPEIQDLQGQHFDEFTLGYERHLGGLGKLSARGIYRTLRQALEDGAIDTVNVFFVWGNPGRGPLSTYPRAKRQYTALELSWQSRSGVRLNGLVSYVLSRNQGNYPGLANTDYGWDFPNANGSFDLPWMMINADGLLPNDRTHVFKFSGSYIVGGGLTVGAIGLWESGTPRSRFAGYWWGEGDLLISPRGTAGRTPSLWDLNLRISYQPPLPGKSRMRPKLTLDFLHVASQKRPVTFDQVVYWLDYNFEDGTRTQRMNPNYGQPTQWQPGMAVRMGAEVQF